MDRGDQRSHTKTTYGLCHGSTPGPVRKIALPADQRHRLATRALQRWSFYAKCARQSLRADNIPLTHYGQLRRNIPCSSSFDSTQARKLRTDCSLCVRSASGLLPDHPDAALDWQECDSRHRTSTRRYMSASDLNCPACESLPEAHLGGVFAFVIAFLSVAGGSLARCAAGT